MDSLPTQSGVYWFLSEKNNILYVGKAKNLKKRVQSYSRITTLSGKTKKLVLEARRLKFQVLSSELEALLVEAELIRLHQPPYNILLKDDKSPIYIQITKDVFPKVTVVRKQLIKKTKANSSVFGPFSSGYKVKQVLEILRRIFGWCSNPEGKKPCFYYHIGLCPGVCAGKLSIKEYEEHIHTLKRFLHGKTSEVITIFQKQMKEYVEALEYEKAAELRDKIEYIKYVTSPKHHFADNFDLPMLVQSKREKGLLELKQILKKYIKLPNEYNIDRIEGYDISNTQGTSPTASMVVFTYGQKDVSEYKIFHIRSKNTPDDYSMMKEALIRRQKHPEWGLSNLILIDGGKGQLSSALSVWSWTTPVVSLAKDPDRLVIKKESGKNAFEVISLDAYPNALQILQQVRDESHRFAKKHHTKRKIKDFFTNV